MSYVRYENSNKVEERFCEMGNTKVIKVISLQRRKRSEANSDDEWTTL